MAEATLDWEGAISATEALLEVHKVLVSVAIDLRELGEMTPAEVDAVKQELLDETWRLSKLKQTHTPKVSLESLEQQYAIALEKFDQLQSQFKAGALGDGDFYPSQLATLRSRGKSA